MSETRPTIGIVTALEPVRYGLWNVEAMLLSVAYVRPVQRAGALVVMIPPDPETVANPDQMLDLIDGLILAGGSDVDPASYGAERHPETTGFNRERDEVELALLARAVERDIPVLGICRGMQVMNIAYGGDLVQHLPDLVGHEEHRRNPGSFDGSEHDVALDPGSLVARAAGEEHHVTRSHHHQAVDRIGTGLRVSGHSTLDDLPEAIEDPARGYVLGVQWHPEVDDESQVIDSFVSAARAHASERELRAAL